MTVLDTHLRDTGFPLSWFLRMAKNLTLSPTEMSADAHLAQHVERLARTAPHILEDIGFVRDKNASSPVRTIWRRGTMKVTITTGDPVVTVGDE